MNENTKNALNKVATKLHNRILNGLNFEVHELTWEFDWNSQLPLEDNLTNCAEEEKALDTLTQVGAITGERKSNYIKTQHEETVHLHAPKSIWEDWDAFNPAKREYDFIRYIDSVDMEKFFGFCEEYEINYTEKRIEATLEITDQIPSVQADGKKYYFKALKSGTALEIIEAAATHRDELLSAAKLRLLMGKPNALGSQKNFKQIFRNNEFGEGNTLSPFAEISSSSFLLKQTASLTAEQLSAIISAKTN